MSKIAKAARTEAEMSVDDENDSVLRMLDDPKVSTEEIFAFLGWEPMPTEVREVITGPSSSSK